MNDIKLFDLLEKADENKVFYVLDIYDNEIARYDGKDSIPEELNQRYVKSVIFYDYSTKVTIY